MPQTPHLERHFTASETVRDIVIGMSDGLSVSKDFRSLEDFGSLLVPILSLYPCPFSRNSSSVACFIRAASCQSS